MDLKDIIQALEDKKEELTKIVEAINTLKGLGLTKSDHLPPVTTKHHRSKPAGFPIECPNCHRKVRVRNSKQRYCSKSCASLHTVKERSITRAKNYEAKINRVVEEKLLSKKPTVLIKGDSLKP